METITVTSPGDVRLIAGHDRPVKFLVNSSVLRLASPVFAALMRPNFSEGRRLQEIRAGDAAVDIRLPDDNPRALELFLNIIYTRQTPTFLALADLVDLAVFVDKYDCAQACCSQTTTWMKSNLRKIGITEDLMTYLCLAVVFESTEIYDMAMVGMALTMRTSPPVPLPKTANLTRIWSRASRVVADLRTSYMKSIHQHIDHLVTMICHDYVEGLIDAQSTRERHSSLWGTWYDEEAIDHDRHMFDMWYERLTRCSAMLPDIEDSPLTLMHKLCRLARSLRGNEQGQKWSCNICISVKHRDLEIQQTISKVLGKHDGTYPRPPFSRGASQKDLPFQELESHGNVEHSVSWLFESALSD